MAAVPKQETFDRVVAHARRQRKRSFMPVGDSTSCAYRSPDGLKCFAGCLIPDSKYRPSMELHSAKENTRAGRVIKKLGHDLGLVRGLQKIHDGNPPGCWEEEFRVFAKRCGLNYTPPAKAATK